MLTAALLLLAFGDVAVEDLTAFLVAMPLEQIGFVGNAAVGVLLLASVVLACFLVGHTIDALNALVIELKPVQAVLAWLSALTSRFQRFGDQRETREGLEQEFLVLLRTYFDGSGLSAVLSDMNSETLRRAIEARSSYKQDYQRHVFDIYRMETAGAVLVAASAFAMTSATWGGEWIARLVVAATLLVLGIACMLVAAGIEVPRLHHRNAMVVADLLDRPLFSNGSFFQTPPTAHDGPTATG